MHSDGTRQCTRPFGHEMQTDLNPAPTPHIFATTDPSSLGQPVNAQNTQPLPGPLQVTPPNPVQGFTVPGTVNDQYLPADQQPAPLSFQVPPTPEGEPHQETNLQPPAPAAPFWQQP
jgi:hypothetical protein